VEAADPSHPNALPRVYAAWRCRTLAGAIVATAVGLVVHGPMGEIRAYRTTYFPAQEIHFREDEPPAAADVVWVNYLRLGKEGPRRPHVRDQ
jgi:hypothetical protein